MIQEPFIFLGIFVISLISSSLLLRDDAGPFKSVALRLFFIGVIFHELAHYVMSLVVGHVPDGIEIKWRHEKTRKRYPHGFVKPGKPLSFLQSFLIGFAPLYLSTWLIFYLWFGVVFNPQFMPLIRVIAGFISISLLLTASPSSADFRFISHSFKNDPTHSWYQIFLVIISTIILWFILSAFQINFFLDFFYYVAIAGLYFLLKFSFIGLGKIYNILQSRNYKKPSKLRFKRFTRKHYKPRKPKADW